MGTLDKEERWRAKARAAIRRYPALVQAENDLRSGRITPSYTGIPSRTKGARATEILATRELPKDDQKDLRAIRYALDTLRRYRNGDLRKQLVELVYWRKTHTVDGAAMVLHVSPETAHSWDRGFIELVDAYRRLPLSRRG